MDFDRRSRCFTGTRSRKQRHLPPTSLAMEFALPSVISNIAVSVTAEEQLDIFSVDCSGVVHYTASKNSETASTSDPASSSSSLVGSSPSSSVTVFRRECSYVDDTFPAIAESPFNLFTRPVSTTMVAAGKGDVLIIDKTTLKATSNLFTLWDTSLVFRSNSAADFLCPEREDLIVVSSSGSAGCVFDLRCPDLPVQFFNDGSSMTPELYGRRRNQVFARHHSVVGITTCCGLGEYAVLAGLADGHVALYDLRAPCMMHKRGRSPEGNIACKVQVANFISKISRDDENLGQIAVLSSTGCLTVCPAAELLRGSQGFIRSSLSTQPMPEIAPLHCPKRTAAFVPGSNGCVASTWPSSNGVDLVCLTPPYTDSDVHFGHVGHKNIVPYFHLAVGLGVVLVATGGGKVAVFR